MFKYLQPTGERYQHNPFVYYADKRHQLQPTLVAGEKPARSTTLLTVKEDRFVEILWEPPA